MNQTIVAPHQRPIEVTHGPQAESKAFRHENEVVQLEEEMVGSMQEFRIQAVEHNQEFLRKTEEIRNNINWQNERIDMEQKERKEQFKKVWNSLAEQLKATTAELENEIEEQFQKYYDNHLSPLSTQKGELEEKAQKFYKTYVPNLYRRQVGRVAEEMRTQHESFAVENKKVLAREQVIRDNIEKHAQKTQERLEVEKDDRYRQTVAAEESFHYSIRYPQRLEEESMHSRITGEIREVSDKFAHESTERGRNDQQLVKHVEKLMNNVQKTLLDNFAAQESDDSEDSA
eukprot:gb/GECG01013617.1/.p1 GENE.gb/GECG01013617.1/~~gb/GECG01013617.1/.p1  ORF type:complete len:287 (+),score=62.70 gb/GECG01013617.1/:1-861(+)